MRLHELFERRTFGIRPGIDHLRGVYEALGRPCSSVPAIHIVGTNGKGSTAAMCDHALRRRGRRVGLYTSPHLVRVNERVRVQGDEVDDAPLEHAINRVLQHEPTGAHRGLSFFEVLTLAALVVFDDARVDALVAEAGLGGRLDATRLVNARAVIVTSIGLDHQQWLGDTLEAVAAEKAGVFVPGVEVFAGPLPPVAQEVMRQRTAEVGCPFRLVLPLPRGPVGLPGAHQGSNTALALAACSNLAPSVGYEDIEGTTWPGRLERVQRECGELWFDVGHNPHAVAAVVEFFAGRPASPRLVVFGCSTDRPAAKMMSDLSVLGPTWWVPVDAAPAVPLPAQSSFDGPTDPALLSALHERLRAGMTVVVMGSHRLVGPLRQWARQRSTPIDPSEITRRGP